MDTGKKVTRFFSWPLMKQNIKANWLLCVAILLLMVLMSNVVNYAVSMMETDKTNVDVEEYQEEFYTYLSALATYDMMTGEALSYSDFKAGDKNEVYEAAFGMLNAQGDMNLSVEGFEDSIEGLSQSGIEIEKYVSQFEYVFALAQTQGVFDGEELTVSGMMELSLEMMGVDPEMIEKMGEMDTTAMMNRMYYTLTGLLPIFLLIVILANSLIANQVDRGSMAYVLSTPTRRSAVVITQAVFLIVVPLLIIAVVCATRIASSFVLFDEVNVTGTIALFTGMYILVEAVCGICYLASCWFSQSKLSMGVGGGLTVWFFLASMLGMFGSEDMVNTGMGVEELSIFNKLTIIGLYDVEAISTVGTDVVDDSFIWKLVVLGVIAIGCYIAGAVKFTKKDLPL